MQAAEDAVKVMSLREALDLREEEFQKQLRNLEKGSGKPVCCGYIYTLLLPADRFNVIAHENAVTFFGVFGDRCISDKF
jgi:hypothetical protein